MIYIPGSINEFVDEFTHRVTDFLDNLDGVEDVAPETLARWVGEVLAKHVVDVSDADDEQDTHADDEFDPAFRDE